jgi:rubrerythrin
MRHPHEPTFMRFTRKQVVHTRRKVEVMNTMQLATVAATLCLLSWAHAAETAGKSTLDNLQAAFAGESNAQSKYTAFAVKADEEGYKSVAALFRATAMSEGIHAKKHAAAIKKLGAEAQAVIAKADVKSTKENLEAALAGETHEKDSMYPEFIKVATAEKNKQAVRSFQGAMAAEVEHAKLYAQALAELDAWKPAGKEFVVCQICGYTASLNNTQLKCPVCAAPKEKFTPVK